MQRPLLIALLVVVLIVCTFGFAWLASRGFGMRQAIEFFPYSDQVKADDGTIIRSSGVVVLVNERGAMPSDQDIAGLMVSVKQMYPKECSGENWEIDVRRPLPNGEEERYSFYSSNYETGGPGSWIEYGRWTNDVYTVLDNYRAGWDEVAKIAEGKQQGFKIDLKQSKNGI
jgi:hypothetical protein